MPTGAQWQLAAELLQGGASSCDPRIASCLHTARQALRRQLGESFAAEDAELDRFLVAQKLNIYEARAMLLRRRAWSSRELPVVVDAGVRAELNKRKLERTPFVTGEGHAILAVRSARYDPATRNLDDCLRATVHLLEAVLDGPDARVCVYYDRHGFDVRANWDLPYLQAVIALLAANYPERLDRVHVFPANDALALLWQLIQPLLDGRTASKVVLHSTSEELREHIPDALVPDSLGGAYAPSPTASKS